MGSTRMADVMGSAASHSDGDGPSAILGQLRERDGASFVADTRAALGMSGEDFEEALARLVASGRVVVQHNFCADPHFVDDDLRAVALVDSEKDDSRSGAAAACDRLWQRWMANFLSSHRCT